MNAAGIGAVLAAFPQRPLVLNPPRPPLAGRLATMAGWLFFIGVLIATLVWIWPALQSDWKVRDSAQPVRGGTVSGKCHSKVIFHICDVTLGTPPPHPIAPVRPLAPVQPLDPTNRPIKRDVTYMFVDFHLGAYEMLVMADPRRPELLTKDLGLDKFYNRAISLGALWLFMLAGALVSAKLAWRSSKVHNAVLASSGQVLIPVVLQLVNHAAGRRNATWTVRDQSGVDAEWTVPAATRPFILGSGAIVLGIAGPGGNAMPLDAELRWIDLTEAERAAIFTAQAHSIASTQAEFATIQGR